MNHIDHNRGIIPDPNIEKDYQYQLAQKLAKVSGQPLAEVEKSLGLEPSEEGDDQQ